MNYLAIDKCSTCNGLGFRVVLWVAGCDHHCEGCHNPSTWNCNAGKPYTIEVFEELMELLDKPYIRGLTVSGGDPLKPENRLMVDNIICSVRALLPQKDIWVYTGYTFEEVKDLPVMDSVDYLVDGKFEIDKRDITLPFRGSSNQRIIDVKKSIDGKEVVELVIN